MSDLRSIIRVAQGRQGQPDVVVMDGRTLQSSCESGPRAGYDGYKRGSKVHMAVDTLDHLLAVHVMPADEQERAQVQRLCKDVQQATGHTVQPAWAGQGYTGDAASKAAQDNGIDLQIVKLPEAKKGFVLLPRRWWWWREASAGWRDSAGSLGTTSDCPKCSVGCISWCLRCSCSPLLHGYWLGREVHNTLQASYGSV